MSISLEWWKSFFLKELKIVKNNNYLKRQQLEKELCICSDIDTVLSCISYKGLRETAKF